MALSRPFNLSITIPLITHSQILWRLYKAFFPIKPQTTNKNNQFCEDLPVVFTREQVRLRSEVPRLNTPGLFPFGGEAHLELFPIFVDKFSTNLCFFFIVLRRMNLFNRIWERQGVFLRNDIRKKLATLFGPNHKTAVKP